jgi:hypothetical protein
MIISGLRQAALPAMTNAFADRRIAHFSGHPP